MVHHSESLSQVIISQPGHPFSQIPLLNNQDLLTELKSLVSIKPSSKIDAPTVIPPHVKMMSQVTDIMALLQAERNDKLNFQDRILEKDKQSIEAHAFSNGHLTHDFVLNLFQRHQSNVNETLKHQNESLNAKIDNLLLVLRGKNIRP